MRLNKLCLFFCFLILLLPDLIISTDDEKIKSEIHEKLKELEKEFTQQEKSFDNIVNNLNQEYEDKKAAETQKLIPEANRRKIKQEQRKNSLPEYQSSFQQKDKFDEQLDRLNEKQKQNEDIFEELDKLTENLDKEFSEQMEQIDQSLKTQKDIDDQFSIFQQMASNNPFQKILDFFSQAIQEDMNQNNELTALADETDQDEQAPTFLSQPKHKTITKTTRIFKNAQGQTTAIIEETEIHTKYKKLKQEPNTSKQNDTQTINIIETTNSSQYQENIEIGQHENQTNEKYEYNPNITVSSNKNQTNEKQQYIPNITVSSNKNQTNKLPVKISQEKVNKELITQRKLLIYCSIMFGLLLLIYSSFCVYRNCQKNKSKIINKGKEKKYAMD